jgi:hypothetical protein
MKPLFTKTEILVAKSNDFLPCECYNCGKVFLKKSKYIKHHLKYPENQGSISFCSQKCSQEFRNKSVDIECKNCGKQFSKTQAELKRHPNSFCSRSCSATYNNRHKTSGTRRSKLEIYLEGKLKEIYPDITIDFNKTDAIGSELDIYFPTLRLAFELNGIFHYEPIYGAEKLSKIQTNDSLKFQECIKKRISLCVIDTSSLSYFKPEKANSFLSIITEIVNKNIS